MQVISREKPNIVNNFDKLLITFVDFYGNALISAFIRLQTTFAFGKNS